MSEDLAAPPTRTFARIVVALVCLLGPLLVLNLAFRPVDAWRAGSAALDDAALVGDRLVLRIDSELALEPRVGGVFVSTGDGGGAGAIDGLSPSGPLRAAETWLDGRRAWEIGTHRDEPATLIDDNGIRLDDGISDRLALRGWWLASSLLLVGLAFVLVRLDDGRVPARRGALIALFLILAAACLVYRD